MDGKINKQGTITNLRKKISKISSRREVQVTYRGTDGDVRIYDAKTSVKGKVHHYTVRVEDWFNDSVNEMDRDFRCTCVAKTFGVMCCHVLKVADFDATQLQKGLSPTFQARETDNQTELMNLFNELPESVQEDVLMMVRTFHAKYGFSK